MLAVGIALFAFGSYVAHLRRDATLLVTRAVTLAKPGDDARDAGRSALARFAGSGSLILVFVDAHERVTDLLESGGPSGPHPVLKIRSRDDLGAEPSQTGALARLALGLATVFGLDTVRSHAGHLEIYARVNQTDFVRDVREYVPAFFIVMLLATIAALSISRLLTRRALKPLFEVTQALENLAAGDFTPRFVHYKRDPVLGSLSRAYNGAVAAVENAFAERDRASSAMRQFTADAGHQLRTPLTVIRGFIGILRGEQQPTAEEYAGVLQSMAQQSLVMSALIDKLILLEQWELADHQSSHEPFEINDFVIDVLSPFRAAHPQRALTIERAPSAFATFDPAGLMHALTNVVDNALKYTPGSVTVRLQNVRGRTRIEIEDGGPGMSAEHSRRAFDRFFRGTRRDVQGSGLGLAIAKRAVERIGGEVALESSVERGTKIAFEVPTSPPPPDYGE